MILASTLSYMQKTLAHESLCQPWWNGLVLHLDFPITFPYGQGVLFLTSLEVSSSCFLDGGTSARNGSICGEMCLDGLVSLGPYGLNRHVEPYSLCVCLNGLCRRGVPNFRGGSDDIEDILSACSMCVAQRLESYGTVLNDDIRPIGKQIFRAELGSTSTEMRVCLLQVRIVRISSINLSDLQLLPATLHIHHTLQQQEA